MTVFRTVAIMLVVALTVAQVPGGLSAEDGCAGNRQLIVLHRGMNGAAFFSNFRHNGRSGDDAHLGPQAAPALEQGCTDSLSALLHAFIEAHPMCGPTARATLISLHCMMNS